MDIVRVAFTQKTAKGLDGFSVAVEDRREAKVDCDGVLHTHANGVFSALDLTGHICWDVLHKHTLNRTQKWWHPLGVALSWKTLDEEDKFSIFAILDRGT